MAGKKKAEVGVVAGPEQMEIKISEIRTSSLELVKIAQSLTINSDEDNKKANEIGLQAKARLKRIEELRLFFVQDLTRKVNEINGKFRVEKKPLEDIVDLVDKKTIDWRRRENARIEEERKKREEKERKAFEKQQEKARIKAEKEAEAEKKRLAKLGLSKKDEKEELKKIEEEKNEKLNLADRDEFNFDDSDFKQSKTIHSEVGSVTFRKDWDFKVIDPVQVPREFTQIDLVAIRKAVKSGTRNIPGVEIFETEIVNRKI